MENEKERLNEALEDALNERDFIEDIVRDLSFGYMELYEGFDLEYWERELNEVCNLVSYLEACLHEYL